jgi:2'-5' RNA ligase
MRLFIAVNFSDEIKDRLFAIQEQLRSQAARGSFSRPENFHLTLAFLGETGPHGLSGEKLEILFRLLEEIQSPGFEISFNRTGCFTHSKKELWWIGADPDCPDLPLLKSIHGHLVSRLEEEAFPVDKRPFSAHITLGREIKHARPIILDKPDISVKVNHISLMKSEHVKGKLTYTELHKSYLDFQR